MYKFPVTKNGVEYGVSICKHYSFNAFNDCYEAKLYKKKKVLLFNVMLKVFQKIHYFDPNDETYRSQLEIYSLYKHIAEMIVKEYEDTTYINRLICNNEWACKNWDGKINS